MAGFPSSIPGPGVMGGAMQGGAPPPTVPGITQPPITPPADLMKALQKKPESAQTLMRQAIVLLEQVAEMDPRLAPRVQAASKLLRGPARPNSEV